MGKNWLGISLELITIPGLYTLPMTFVHSSFNKHLLSAHCEPDAMPGTGGPTDKQDKVTVLWKVTVWQGRQTRDKQRHLGVEGVLTEEAGNWEHTGHPTEVVAPAQSKGPWEPLPHAPLAYSGAQHHPDSGRQMPVSHSQSQPRTFLQWSLWKSWWWTLTPVVGHLPITYLT